MLNSDEWKGEVIRSSPVFCVGCKSKNVTMGACAIDSYTVHQEYYSEDCRYEYSAMFALVECYPGHQFRPDTKTKQYIDY